nr:cobalt-precorrin-5B (C(1))-methyltransferase CbiD [Methanobrevibacter arboriphilus]
MNNYEKENQFDKNDYTHSNVDYGLTTGSIATATSLAAIKKIINSNEEFNIVKIITPFEELDVDIEKCELINENKAETIGVKYPYNDPDVTVNLKIISSVELIDKKEIYKRNIYKSDIYKRDTYKKIMDTNNLDIDEKIENKVIVEGGFGVGTITKPGLQIPVGESAINPVPLDMIQKNLAGLVPDGKIAKVIISVPEGEKIAKKTMNPKLGIIGGISILGTTGIARAMSTKAYKDSLLCQLDMAIALIDEGKYKKDEIVFVPGNIGGEKLALRDLNLKDNKKVKKDQIVQTGNYIGFMLEEAKKREIDKITLFGHIGKLVKVAGGIFNTKHSIADGRREIIATHAGLCGADTETIKSILIQKLPKE